MYYAARLAKCKENTIDAGAQVSNKTAPTSGGLVGFDGL